MAAAAKLSVIPHETAVQARALAQHWREKAPRKRWALVADELERRGLGRWLHYEIADAVTGLPAEAHPDAGLGDNEMSAVLDSWIDGWAVEFPSEPWPGLTEAQRRIREKNWRR